MNIYSSHEISYMAPFRSTNLFSVANHKSPPKKQRKSVRCDSNLSNQNNDNNKNQSIPIKNDKESESKQIELNNYNDNIKKSENNYSFNQLLNDKLQDENNENSTINTNLKNQMQDLFNIETDSLYANPNKSGLKWDDTEGSNTNKSNNNNRNDNNNQNDDNNEIEDDHQGTIVSSSITATYVNQYPFTMNIDNGSKQMIIIDDEKDKEIVSMASSGTSIQEIDDIDNNKLKVENRNPITSKALADTMDYSMKLMATIQQMNEHNNLKYKLSKYDMKIKKLERQLNDEKKINEDKTMILDKVNAELNKTNVEIERIEKEKRDLKSQLKPLEEVQQKWRMLQMQHMQLQQEHKSRGREINNLNKTLSLKQDKLKRTLEDRDNISHVSETMREELTNKNSKIKRLKEINKELTDKLNKCKENNRSRMMTTRGGYMNDTLYSAPDATRLYDKMDEFEQNANLIEKVKDLEEKYECQSIQCHKLKLEIQALKQKNNKLSKDSKDCSEKLKIWKNELKTMKLNHENDTNELKGENENLQKELTKKNGDIEKLKTALFNINEYMSSQSSPKSMTPTSMKTTKINEDVIHKTHTNTMNMTSLSFEHDLDLEVEIDDNENNNHNNLISKNKNNNNKYQYQRTKRSIKASKGLSSKASSSSSSSKSTSSKTFSSSGNLLDDITACIANQKRSRNSLGSKSKNNQNKKNNTKHVKQTKIRTINAKNVKNIRRQFLPNNTNNVRNNRNHVRSNNNNNNNNNGSMTSSSLGSVSIPLSRNASLNSISSCNSNNSSRARRIPLNKRRKSNNSTNNSLSSSNNSLHSHV